MNLYVSKKIRKIRLSKGFSQEYVAGKLCISQSAYARLEKGETNSWAVYLEKLCDIFETTPQYIVSNDHFIKNQNEKTCACNKPCVINHLSVEMIKLYEARLLEKDKIIKKLEELIIQKDLLIKQIEI